MVCVVDKNKDGKLILVNENIIYWNDVCREKIIILKLGNCFFGWVENVNFGFEELIFFRFVELFESLLFCFIVVVFFIE